MLNYKDIIIKHYALSLSGSEIARQLGASKSGVNDFLRAFDKCESLSYPLPPGITNYGIAELVYGSVPGSGGRNESIEYPDYEADAKLMATRKNMTLVFLWNRYSKKCAEEGKRFYQYRQYCELYNKWCDENYETAHFDAVIAQKMEVDFAGQTFDMTDPLTGETLPIVVFVAILPYSQYIYEKECSQQRSHSGSKSITMPLIISVAYLHWSYVITASRQSSQIRTGSNRN